MSDLLLWLATPMAFLPLFVRRNRLGGAAGQLILAGLGLAALHQGAGTLDPRNLHSVAGQSPSDAWFVGITAGAMLTGACVVPGAQLWRKVLLAGPLAVGLLFAGLPHFVPMAIGALIGVVPAVLGLGSMAGYPVAVFARRSPTMVILVTGTVVCAVIGPLAVAMTLLAALTWMEWRTELSSTVHTGRLEAALGRVPVVPVVATLLVAAWTWLAVTIAGAPMISLPTFASEAPVSAAAAEWLALLGVAWGFAIARPWPLRSVDAAVSLPALAVVLYLAVGRGTPEGAMHWQALLTLIAVPLGVFAAWSGAWTGAAAALLLVAATRSGPSSAAAAALVSVMPLGLQLKPPARLVALAVGVVVALVVTSVLRDEVLLALLLAFGVAAAANRHDHVVALA